MSVYHAKASTMASSTDATLVLSTDWNSAHSITGYCLSKVSWLTGSGTYTVGSSGRAVFIEAWGGGGGGAGGGSTAASTLAVGAGGGAGGYSCLWRSTVTTSGYAYVCGTGGSGGTTLAHGSTGGITTWTSSSGTLITVNGGSYGTTQAGAATVAIVQGGAGGTAGTGGDLNLAGGSGEAGYRISGTAGMPGFGGTSPFPPGVAGAFNWAAVGGAATYAQGGGGTAGVTATSGWAGGVGGAGIICVTEYY
jgi:hypothetical protein